MIWDEAYSSNSMAQILTRRQQKALIMETLFRINRADSILGSIYYEMVFSVGFLMKPKFQKPTRQYGAKLF